MVACSDRRCATTVSLGGRGERKHDAGGRGPPGEPGEPAVYSTRFTTPTTVLVQCGAVLEDFWSLDLRPRGDAEVVRGSTRFGMLKW